MNRLKAGTEAPLSIIGLGLELPPAWEVREVAARAPRLREQTVNGAAG